VPSLTRGWLAMGSTIQFYQITEPDSLPYSCKGCSRPWVLKPILPRLTTPKLMGKSDLSLVLTAYNSQVHSSAGQVAFAFVSPRWLTLVAIERLTAGTELG